MGLSDIAEAEGSCSVVVFSPADIQKKHLNMLHNTYKYFKILLFERCMKCFFFQAVALASLPPVNA